MTDHTQPGQTERHWADGHRLPGIPQGGAEITVTVPADASPAAVILATSLQRLIDAAAHVDALDTLSVEQAYYLLNDVRRATAAARAVEEKLILAHRAAGASWASLGAALDTGRSAASERHERIRRAAERGLTTRSLDEAESGEAAPPLDVAGSLNIHIHIQDEDNR